MSPVEQRIALELGASRMQVIALEHALQEMAAEKAALEKLLAATTEKKSEKSAPEAK